MRAVLENPNAFGKHATLWTRVYGSSAQSIKMVSNSYVDALSHSLQASASEVRLGEAEVQVAVVGSGDGGCRGTIPKLLQADPQD